MDAFLLNAGEELAEQVGVRDVNDRLGEKLAECRRDRDDDLVRPRPALRPALLP